MDKFRKLVSLGYICTVFALKFQTLERKDRKSMVFDNVGVPMWAVHDLIKNDFSDFIEPENVEKRKLFKDSDEEIWVDKKYYTRFMFSPEKIKPKLNKKIENFRNALGSKTEPILFVRYKEMVNYDDRGDRIKFSEYDAKYAITERKYLEQLSDHFKATYPELEFKILFMSDEENSNDTDHNIVTINTPKLDYRNKRIGKQMQDVLTYHKEFLDANL
tara:strand:- start:3100 stop:3750 length:651 start_codon:yes stop_codon:yes gene_type:complete